MTNKSLPTTLAELQQRLLTSPPSSQLRQTFRLFQGIAPVPPVPPPGQKHMKEASVALLIAQTAPDAPLELLCIQRATRAGDPWSGHMGLPGGRRDPQDPSSLDAAIRESYEELGLSLQHEQVLAPIPPHFAWGNLRKKPLWVHPFLFGLTEKPTLTPNDEVAHALWVPLAHLLDPKQRSWMLYPWRKIALPFPCVRYQGYVIWGLTLRILQTLDLYIRR
ncbi:MAG: CoA pyrophosphatase [Myxococcales bacterium]|nr:CoA pyrophosphatase [Myxococcales bacterium]MCB9644440.1 CoA pyrophosphatase [Myxococcales bacterium]